MQKNLRHAAYKAFLDGDKEEKKKLFKEALVKLEEKKKITVNESVVKLISKIVDDVVDVIVDVKSDVKEKKRKIKELNTNEISNNETEKSCETVELKAKNKKIKNEGKSSKSVIEQTNIIETPAVVIPPSIDNIIVKKEYPPIEIPTGNNTILLFYAYCTPIMSRADQDKAIAHCYKILSSNNVTGKHGQLYRYVYMYEYVPKCVYVSVYMYMNDESDNSNSDNDDDIVI